MKDFDLEISFDRKPTCDGVVSPEEYILALEERIKNMNNETLGHFVKKTIWTVTGRK